MKDDEGQRLAENINTLECIAQVLQPCCFTICRMQHDSFFYDLIKKSKYFLVKSKENHMIRKKLPMNLINETIYLCFCRYKVLSQ